MIIEDDPPHQYRCETCKYLGEEECPYDVMMYNRDGCDNMCVFIRPANLKEFIKVCGCASHSDVQKRGGCG